MADGTPPHTPNRISEDYTAGRIETSSQSQPSAEKGPQPSSPQAQRSGGDWRDLRSLPRDETILITVEPTEKHPYLYGSPRWPRTYCAYVNEDGRLCDSGTFEIELGFEGPNFRTIAWMPLPDPLVHASDCALHNAPALPVGPCDCGALSTATGGSNA